MRRFCSSATGSAEEHRMTKKRGFATVTAAGATLLACSIALALPVFAQTNPYLPISHIPLGDSLLSLPTAHIPAEGTWEVKFTHRFNQSIDQGDGSDRLHTLFGLDSNADVGFGLSWAPRRDLQFSALR